MESSSGGRCGEIASDISIILVTAAQLVFFAFFYKYIAWYTTEADGSVTRLSLLTDDYFTWLPIVIAASILVIVGYSSQYRPDHLRQVLVSSDRLDTILHHWAHCGCVIAGHISL